jgi:hypothetical protein
VANASVKVKGRDGSCSGSDGKYSIPASPGDIIEISIVGFQTHQQLLVKPVIEHVTGPIETTMQDIACRSEVRGVLKPKHLFPLTL